MPARSDQHAAVVLCPMRIEHAHVSAELRRAGLSHVRVLQTGVGREAILRCVARVENASLLILAGAAGGLVECEDVPPIARIIDERGTLWTPVGAPTNGATLIGVDTIISTPTDKRALAARTGAAIVDMESHAFAAHCDQLGVQWSVVRGVSDTPDETLPHEVLGWITPEGDTRAGRAVLDMVRRPTLVPHIAGVVRRSRRILPLVGKRVVQIIRDWERCIAAGDGA